MAAMQMANGRWFFFSICRKVQCWSNQLEARLEQQQTQQDAQWLEVLRYVALGISNDGLQSSSMVSQASESEFTIATCGQWANLKIETNAFSTFQGRFSSFKRFRYGLVDHVCDTEMGS